MVARRHSVMELYSQINRKKSQETIFGKQGVWGEAEELSWCNLHKWFFHNFVRCRHITTRKERVTSRYNHYNMMHYVIKNQRNHISSKKKFPSSSDSFHCSKWVFVSIWCLYTYVSSPVMIILWSWIVVDFIHCRRLLILRPIVIFNAFSALSETFTPPVSSYLTHCRFV